MGVSTFDLVTVAAPLVGVAYFAWLFIDVVQRRRSKLWLFFGLIVGMLTAPFWLWSRRRSPVVETPSRTQKLLLVAVALALLVGFNVFHVAFVTWGFTLARVEGRAMSQTLNDQDRLIVNRAVYLMSEPALSDIVMVRYPNDPERVFVERIVAAEGDRIEVKDGHFHRNGGLVSEPYVSPELRSHENWGPQDVPAGHYFVMGDNRGNSSDSRVWGPVPSDYVLGRVSVRLWPSFARVHGPGTSSSPPPE
jgi:signal peptidase I